MADLVDNLLNLDENKLVYLKAYDVLGKEIFNMTGGKNSIMVQYNDKIKSCNPGIYLIQIRQEGESKLLNSKIYLTNQ